MEVAAGDAERPVVVRHGGRVRLRGAGAAGDAAERIHRRELQARIDGRRVLHRVVDAEAVVVVVDVARRREHAAQIVVGGDALHEIDERVVLAAERERAVAVARQADERLPAEQAAALTLPAAARIEAVLQLEQRLQPAAEILGAFHAPAAAGEVARAAVTEHPRVVLALFMVHIGDRRVDHAIQRDARLRMRDGHRRERRERNQREGRAFHVISLAHWCGFVIRNGRRLQSRTKTAKMKFFVVV